MMWDSTHINGNSKPKPEEKREQTLKALGM
jgi:hypothetical protein